MSELRVDLAEIHKSGVQVGEIAALAAAAIHDAGLVQVHVAVDERRRHEPACQLDHLCIGKLRAAHGVRAQPRHHTTVWALLAKLRDNIRV